MSASGQGTLRVRLGVKERRAMWVIIDNDLEPRVDMPHLEFIAIKYLSSYIVFSQ
jgi:hypothetical protein